MKKYKQAGFIVCLVMLSIASCSFGDKYPLLKIENQYDGKYISSVSLVGYEFSNLSILYGNSQTFTLGEGMPGGYNNINIQVGYRSGSAIWYISNQFDFKDGDVTIVTLKGSSLEGHPDYNNSRLE
jgi:hypothetical protein